MKPDTHRTDANRLALLDQWSDHGWLRPLDRAFVELLRSREPDAPTLVLLAAALASHQLGRGHVCLDMGATLARPEETLGLPPDGEAGELRALSPQRLLDGVTEAAWIQSLAASPLIATEGENRPLVLNAGRLYLHRFWHCTRTVARTVLRRCSHIEPAPEDLAARLDRRFSALRTPDEDEKTEVHWQTVAAALAVNSGFGVISGGPGTGKTTTVVHLLALLQELALEDGVRLRIRLAAPTGKAAARLTESLGQAAGRLPETLRAAVAVEVTTLHRLLGSRPGTRHFFHHGANPLHVDLLVVDEASMIDLEMMAALLDALPDTARVILLGDKDQLASVEAGSVLGDLCRHVDPNGFPADTATWIQANTGYEVPLSQDAPTPLTGHVAVLHKSHRFGKESGIGQLARAVNGGDPRAVADVWEKGYDDIARINLTDPDDANFSRLVLEGLVPGREAGGAMGYRHYLRRLQAGPPDDSGEDHWIERILSDFGRFQILSPLRKGTWGVENLSRKTAEILFRKGLIPATEGWYAGRPVMITRNDYALGLMNGDTGVVLPVSEPETGQDKVLKAVFPMADGSLKKVRPTRLNDVETVYAMTVHKSQGSEFHHTVLALPERPNLLLTRELIYTAITRSRDRFTLISPRADVLDDGVRRRVHRASGLGDLLQWKTECRRTGQTTHILP